MTPCDGRCSLFRIPCAACAAEAARPGGCCAEPDLPGLPTLLLNLGAAAAAHAVKGFPAASDAARAARVATCEACPSGRYRASDRRCAECGCYVGAKAGLAGEACPLGHWPGGGPQQATRSPSATSG